MFGVLKLAPKLYDIRYTMPPKRTPRQKDWCFTVHAGHWGDDYSTEDEVAARLKLTECSYIVFQPEDGGELGRPHLQGYVMFKSLKTTPSAQEALGVMCHMEMRAADNISDAVNYCKKLDTRRPGTTFFEKGIEPMDNGKKRTLRDACDLAKQQGIKRVAMDMPEEYVRYHAGLGKLANIAAEDKLPDWRDVTVIVVVGDSGCGKSWFAEHYDDRDNTYPMADSDPVWVDGYWGQRTIVVEEMDAKMPFRFLLRLLDGYRLNMPTKGGFIWGEHTTVILTSNTSPDRWYNDGFHNTWSFDTTQMSAGPLQRRINSIHTGTGVYPNTVWDVPLPTGIPMTVSPSGDPPTPIVAPDSSAAPDDLPMEDLHRSNVPGVIFEPTTPGIINLVDDLAIDDFLTMD